MNTQQTSNIKRISTRLSAVLLAVLLLLPACAAPATPPPFGPVEELTFQSGPFKVVGDLRLPGGSGPFPVVLFVHGSGPADRTGFGYYPPVMERMLRPALPPLPGTSPARGSPPPSSTRAIQTCDTSVLKSCSMRSN